jgi:hypothetical protein
MDHGEHAPGLVIVPDTEVFHGAHLFLVGEYAREAFMEADRFIRFECCEKSATIELVLEQAGIYTRQ